MTFSLTITCNNATFDDLPGELHSILSDVADQVAAIELRQHPTTPDATYTHENHTILDSNGNTTGSWSIHGTRP